MRRSLYALPVAAFLVLPSCRDAELEARHAALAAKEAETAAQLKTRTEELVARQNELALRQSELASQKGELDAARAALSAATADRDATAKRLAEEEKAAKEATERHEKVVKDRDGLREWIQKDLLPVAEAHVPELGNLAKATDILGAEVAKMRGLAWKKPILRRRITRADMAVKMKADLDKEFAGEKGKDLVAVGEEIGLLKRGSDVAAILTQFLDAGVAGFYDPEWQMFCLVEGNDGRGAYPVVFHELVHALEDQYFPLDPLYESVSDDDDRALAVRGLVEGSAAMFQDFYQEDHPADVEAMNRAQATPDAMQRQMKMITTVPAFVIGTIAFYPYNNGKDWVRTVTGGDPSKVNALFGDLPDSTEQVLHPEKFTAAAGRDRPHRIDAPDLSAALPPEWRRTSNAVMGELQLGCLLAQLKFPGPQATLNILNLQTQGLGFKGQVKTAVEGWDGDRAAAAVDPKTGRATICWVSVWDTPEDATEFVEFYGSLLGKRLTGETPDALPAPIRFDAKDDGRVSGIVRDGARVTVVLGAPADRFDAVMKAGLDAKVTADPRDPADAGR